MYMYWQPRKIVLTPEEVVERINKVLEEWAEEERAAQGDPQEAEASSEA